MHLKNVVGLFDGMSCGQLALEDAGITYDKYYASEIDKYAIQVCQENFPNTIQLGSVVDLNTDNLTNIDCLLGGSPCQSFSGYGDGSGFEGKSGLFWQYVRVLKELNPKYFLLENVVMKKEWEDVITEAVGVAPIKICSSLVSAQTRRRLYWTNIPNITQPKDLGLNIKDVIDCKFSATYPNYLDLTFCDKKRKDMVKNYNSKASCLTASMYKGQVSSFCKNDEGHIYKYTPEDCEILQTVRKGYTSSQSATQRYKMLGNGWTIKAISHILQHITKQDLLNYYAND